MSSLLQSSSTEAALDSQALAMQKGRPHGGAVADFAQGGGHGGVARDGKALLHAERLGQAAVHGGQEEVGADAGPPHRLPPPPVLLHGNKYTLRPCAFYHAALSLLSAALWRCCWAAPSPPTASGPPAGWQAHPQTMCLLSWRIAIALSCSLVRMQGRPVGSCCFIVIPAHA